MFKQIDALLSADALAELNRIADTATFVDGRISNPHNTTKNNLHLHDAAAIQRSGKIMADALFHHPEFLEFAFPKVLAPPLITKYGPAMRYGLHADAAFMQIGQRPLRADLSCTIFLSDPASYEGGALQIVLGTSTVEIKLAAGSAIFYPSNTMHQVLPVTRGERRVGLTFIESQIANPEHRDWLYELNEVAALEGLTMKPENFMRLQRIQQNLLRAWSDHS
jgi:PKHD-type hydroxylase